MTPQLTPVEVLDAMYAAWELRLQAGPAPDPLTPGRRLLADARLREKRIRARCAMQSERVARPAPVSPPLTVAAVNALTMAYARRYLRAVA